MTSRSRFFPVVALLAGAALCAPLTIRAQSSNSGDRWLHVRVISTNDKSETVKVNVPLDLAEKVLPAIDHDRLHNGRVKLGKDMECDGVDVRALLDAVRTSKDGEFVTVQKKDADIAVAKKEGYLLVHVKDKEHKSSQVEVKVPMKVVEALLSADKDELNIVAALHALAAQGDTELVSVKDEDNTVRVWVDSKSLSD